MPPIIPAAFFILLSGVLDSIAFYLAWNAYDESGHLIRPVLILSVMILALLTTGAVCCSVPFLKQMGIKTVSFQLLVWLIGLLVITQGLTKFEFLQWSIYSKVIAVLILILLVVFILLPQAGD